MVSLWNEYDSLLISGRYLYLPIVNEIDGPIEGVESCTLTKPKKHITSVANLRKSFILGSSHKHSSASGGDLLKLCYARLPLRPTARR